MAVVVELTQVMVEDTHLGPQMLQTDMEEVVVEKLLLIQVEQELAVVE
jgi:hypothetical protein